MADWHEYTTDKEAPTKASLSDRFEALEHKVYREIEPQVHGEEKTKLRMKLVYSLYHRLEKLEKKAVELELALEYRRYVGDPWADPHDLWDAADEPIDGETRFKHLGFGHTAVYDDRSATINGQEISFTEEETSHDGPLKLI